MKLQEFQFCYAVIQGHSSVATELLPQIDLVEADEWGISPAGFCLWASQQTPTVATQRLQILYPNYPLLSFAGESTATAADICKTDIIPAIKEKFKLFICAIADHNQKLEVVTTDKYAFFYECAQTSLKLMSQQNLSLEDIGEIQKMMLKFQIQTLKIATPKSNLQSPLTNSLSIHDLSLTTIEEGTTPEEALFTTTVLTPNYQLQQQNTEGTSSKTTSISTPDKQHTDNVVKKQKTTL